MDYLRIGIIGTGIGLNHAEIIGKYIPSIDGLPIRVCGISSLIDLTKEQTRIIQESSPDVQTFIGPGSASELINSEDINAVIVASPDLYHVQNAVQALALGKPVLVEKPLALNREQGNKLIDYAEFANLPLSLSTQMRYHTRPRQILEEIMKESHVTPRNVSIQIDYALKTPAHGRNLNCPKVDILPHIIPLFPGMYITEVMEIPSENKDLIEFCIENNLGLVNGSALMRYVPQQEQPSRTIKFNSGSIDVVLIHEGKRRKDEVYYERWKMQNDNEDNAWVRNPRELALRDWLEEIVSNSPTRRTTTYKRIREEHNTFMNAIDYKKDK